MLVIFIYYWSRLIASVLFACATAFMLKQKYNGMALFMRFLAAIFLSCTFISIAAEQITFSFCNTFIKAKLPLFETQGNAIFVLYYSIVDIVIYILPIYLYSKLLEERLVVASTIYIEFIIQDRFCQNIAFSALSYFIVYILLLLVLGLVHSKDFEFISNHNEAINWYPVLFFNSALFVLLDILYCAYYIFPELRQDGLTIETIWLDSIVIVTACFAIGFSKINVIVSVEHEKKIKYMRKFQENQSDIIRDFATISEAKSGETGQHVRRVSEYTAIIASKILTNETDVMYIKVASMMHDIGKLMIPNEIIEKPGKLTPEEYEIMKTHSSYGDSLLSHNQSEIMTIARTIAFEHHERWDGNGYPRGLKGDEISIYAQIVSVADVYDALTSRRSYKEPWDSLEAKVEITRQRGYQFSPKVVDIFIEYYNEIDNIRKQYSD